MDDAEPRASLEPLESRSPALPPARGGEDDDDDVPLAALARQLTRQGTPPSEGGRGGGDSSTVVRCNRGRIIRERRLIPVRDQLSDGAR